MMEAVKRTHDRDELLSLLIAFVVPTVYRYRNAICGRSSHTLQSTPMTVIAKGQGPCTESTRLKSQRSPSSKR